MLKFTSVLATMCLITQSLVSCLDNGLARTPPMGWMSWQRYRCTTDCETFPDDCISEKLFKKAANLLVSEGYAGAGYKYVIIDDCWLADSRDKDGKLQPDSKRFPSGIKALADYVHGKGLKFGIYEDYGTKTCAGYPGIIDHMETDAKTFAEWGVDYIKLDGCYADMKDYDKGYPEFGRLLNATGRPIVYSCSWPAYQQGKMEINFTSIAEHCNLWRAYGDIDDSWSVVLNIMEFFGNHKDLVQYAGPGHWNDPDMLIIGNFGLSVAQAEAQMAVWAILAAPLIMSNDLANVAPEFKSILKNKRAIAINQDPFGIQGELLSSDHSILVWKRPISPKEGGNFSYAIAFMSKRTDGMPYRYVVKLQNLGLNYTPGYFVHDVFKSSYNGEILKPDSLLEVRINPTGVVMLQLTVATSAAETKVDAEAKATASIGKCSVVLNVIFLCVIQMIL